MISKKNKMNETNDCLSIETIACYVDGILPEKERKPIVQHLETCNRCKEEIAYQMDIAKQQKKEELIFLPEFLTRRARNLVSERFGTNVLQVIAKFSDKAIEALRVVGETFCEVKPQPVFALRGQDSELVTVQSVSKNFGGFRVEIEIVRQKADLNKIIFKVMDDQTKSPVSDLRVTLMDRETELESYIAQNGKAIFENIKPGNYIIQISGITDPIGMIMLELAKV